MSLVPSYLPPHTRRYGHAVRDPWFHHPGKKTSGTHQWLGSTTREDPSIDIYRTLCGGADCCHSDALVFRCFVLLSVDEEVSRSVCWFSGWRWCADCFCFVVFWIVWLHVFCCPKNKKVMEVHSLRGVFTHFAPKKLPEKITIRTGDTMDFETSRMCFSRASYIIPITPFERCGVRQAKIWGGVPQLGEGIPSKSVFFKALLWHV